MVILAFSSITSVLQGWSSAEYSVAVIVGRHWTRAQRSGSDNSGPGERAWVNVTASHCTCTSQFRVSMSASSGVSLDIDDNDEQPSFLAMSSRRDRDSKKNALEELKRTRAGGKRVLKVLIVSWSRPRRPHTFYRKKTHKSMTRYQKISTERSSKTGSSGMTLS